MRTKRIKIADKEYLACFSSRVLVSLEERGGNADKALADILNGLKVKDVFWLLAELLNAGDRYAKEEGIENPGQITVDELLDRVGVDEYTTMFSEVTAAISDGSKTTVEVQPEKNGEAKREDD